MKLIYTNLGILTEERVRELKECGYGVDECGMAGSWGDDTEMRGFPKDSEEAPAKVIVIRGMDEDMLEEGDTSISAVGGSVTGTQVAVAVPRGPAGASSPSGASVVEEAFNSRAEALLEAWMEEEVEEELHGDQDKLDINKNKKLDKFDFMALRNKKKKKAKKED